MECALRFESLEPIRTQNRLMMFRVEPSLFDSVASGTQVGDAGAAGTLGGIEHSLINKAILLPYFLLFFMFEIPNCVTESFFRIDTVCEYLSSQLDRKRPKAAVT